MGEEGGEDEGREVGEERTEGRSMLEAGHSNLMQHWALLATSTLLATAASCKVYRAKLVPQLIRQERELRVIQTAHCRGDFTLEGSEGRE